MIVGIIIGLVISLVGFGVYYFISSNPKSLNKDFIKSQNKVLNNLKEKKNAFDKEITQEQLVKKAQLNAELAIIEQKKSNAEIETSKKIEELNDDYEERRRNILEKELEETQARFIENQNKINSQAQEYQEALSKLTENYKEKSEELSQSFFQFSEQIDLKRAALTKEIEDYEEKQKKIIARFKEDEEKRQQADFYRIKINDIEKKDIVQLKQLALNFSKPNVIYKLLYEVYYKTKLEELFKRILGDNKDKGGIYKITNINNQKIYIGRTTNYLSRLRIHSKRGCNIDRINGQLYDAMFEEGLENFTWEIVEVCPKEEQSEKEKYWIKFYHSDSYGYNGNAGG